MGTVRVATLAILIGGVASLLACSPGPQSESSSAAPAAQAASVAEAKAPVTPQLLTARECFNRLQPMASRWAADAKPFLLESSVDPEGLGRDGKSLQWSAMFASALRNSTRTFTCTSKGVTGALETPYTSNVLAFDSFLFKTNSDEAFTLAQARGGEAVLKRDPKQPITYVLQLTRGESVPHWFVVYGTEMKNNKGIGVINATTGAFIRASK